MRQHDYIYRCIESRSQVKEEHAEIKVHYKVIKDSVIKLI